MCESKLVKKQGCSRKGRGYTTGGSLGGAEPMNMLNSYLLLVKLTKAPRHLYSLFTETPSGMLEECKCCIATVY